LLDIQLYKLPRLFRAWIGITPKRCRDVACNVSTTKFNIIMYIFDNQVYKSEIRPPK